MALHPDEIRTHPGGEEDRPEPTSTVRLEGGRVLKVRRFTLRVTHGPHAGAERSFDQERVRVGSEPRADLALEKDTAISRSHFEILFTEKGWLVVDLHSTNGTFVDGRRVERAYLGVASELRAGQSELSFRALEDVTELSPDTSGSLGELVAASSELRLVFAAARKVAPLSLPVLVRQVEALSAAAQGKLARALEKDSNARMIATSREDLAARVRDDGFKPELYFKLAVLTLAVPPLRKRPEDLEPVLARALGGKTLEPDALAALKSYPWPGNVRELLNVGAQLSALGGARLGRESLPARVQGRTSEPRLAFNDHLSFHEAKARLVEEFERAYLKELLERCGGNIAEAARQSGLHRKSVERLIKKYQLVAAER